MIVLPKKIYLRAIRKQWRVFYIHTPGKLSIIEIPGHKLIVYGKRYSKHAVIKLLIKWVKMKAEIYLHALLVKINRKVKVNFKQLRIHSLKLEWGSYTSKKMLSLNYSLIFLPPTLVKYIIIHELCHTRYYDHSPQFWREVAKYDKHWKRNAKKVQTADEDYIPSWVIN